MLEEPTVFVVDDEALARTSVCALVRSMGLRSEAYASSEEFLEGFNRERPGCLIADVRMLGMSGLELQEKLRDMGVPLPVIIVTAHARIPLAIRAMKGGAVTMLEKPCDDNELWEAIQDALAQDRRQRKRFSRRQEYRERLALLTEGEQQVLDLIVQGEPNKVIAKRLDLSLRTVEARRHEVFDKTQVDSVAELVRLVMDARRDD